jgi:lipoprotein NlpI
MELSMRFLSFISILLFTLTACAQKPATEEKELARLLQAVKDKPDDAVGHANLAAYYAEQKDYAKAIASMSKGIELDATYVRLRDYRGDWYLWTGEFKKAVADYDVFLKDNPRLEPEHWRRGIAHYYAGMYKEGVAQFETHKTVNPQDVENAVWHYLCNSKVIGTKKAAAELIDVTMDARVPMAEIQKLFAGKLKPEDVLAAADKTDAKKREGVSARFYANLYVALWYDAEGDAKKVKEHLTTAVKHEVSDYMWKVGRAHLTMLEQKK